MKIEDNFLAQKDFDKIQEVMLLPSSFPWLYRDTVTTDDTDKFQFVHIFYKNTEPTGDTIQLTYPILQILQPVSMYRIKANLRTRTLNIEQSSFHVDMAFLPEEKLKQWTTSIFYLNTNNGYTLFDDDTKVESVGNRMVTFPANMKHCGTSCTNEKARIVINFNYFK